MKQRLLLCLLMLMVSVGLVKAADNGDITINILQGETVKIEFTSDGKFKVGTEKSYPTIDGCTPLDKSTTSSVIYEITADKDNPDGKDVIINKEAADFWGNVGINISGKVTSFAVTGPNDKGIDGTDMTNLVSHITSISFTDNGELNNLDLGTGFALTNYLPALKTLSCPDNKLKAFPAEGEGQTFTIGKQNSSTATITGVTDGNPRSLKLTSAVLGGLSFADNAFDGTNLRIISLTTQKDQQGDKIPYDFDDVNSIWHIRDAKTCVYVNGGDYWATIQIVGGAYDGLEIWNVPINLKDATFALDTKNLVDKTNGNDVTVTVKSGNATDQLKKGDQIELIPQPAKGYVFDKFDEANMKGLKRVEGTEGNRWVYEVLGNDDPSIKALFTYGEDVLTFNTSNSGGTLKVYQSTDGKYTNDTELSSGTKLTVGTEITIVATANEGQSFSDITLNGESILSDNESKLDREFKYTTKVVAGGMNIIATFASQKVAFTVERNTGWGQFDIFNDETNKQYSPKSDSPNSENEFTFKNIPANTTLRIEMKLQEPEEQYIKKLAMNGTDYLSSITKLDDDRYVLKYLWTGSNSIRLVAEWAELEDITVTVEETSLVYNGDYQAIKYTVSPASLTDEVKVTYRKNESDSYEEKTPFKEVGDDYYVVFSREQKNPYKKLEKVEKYSITPAPLYITGTPVVAVVKEGTTNVYKVSGLKAQYYQNGKLVPEEGVAGEFKVVDISSSATPTEVEQVPAGMEDGGVVNIRFYAEDGTNFVDNGVIGIHKVAYGTAKNSIAVEAIESEGLGDTELIMKSASGLIGSEVQDGTKIDFDIINPDPILKKNNMYHVYLVDGEGNILDGGSSGEDFLNNGYTVNKAAIEQGTLIFRLDVDGRSHLAVSDAGKDKLTKKVTYTGEVQEYPIDNTTVFPLKIQETGKDYTLDKGKGDWTIVYLDEYGQAVEPKNVGTYTVKMTRKATANYYAFEVTGKLVIEQAELPANSIPAPSATQVTKGSPLWYSRLDGPVSILGYYDWAENVRNEKVTETKSYQAVFIPQDKNYATYELPEVVEVQVTDAAVLSISWTGYGSVYATDKAGNRYWGGDEILPGTELTIHAIPNTDCYLASLTKDGATIANGASFTFEDEPVSIYAEFEIYVPEPIIPDPEPTDPVIDENSQYIVEVKKATTNNRGFILGKEGENGVYYTKSFEFTVNALDADLDKLVVTGATKVSKGKYRINSVTSNTTVTVSLPNPTPIDVKIVTESKNTKGYLVGKVKAEQYPLDGKCYYGDELVVVAYPVDGVSFAHWRDNTSNRDQMREITVTKAMTIEAVFSGVPTGIEDIESAGIYAGRGYIQVKNVSNADLTVVSISGRIQTRQHLEGDVQVRVPAGVYVVVLENGQDVKRVKVIVR